jgi:protein-L-isoaspartate(D-aspartate) O-methyltransferase
MTRAGAVVVAALAMIVATCAAPVETSVGASSRVASPSEQSPQNREGDRMQMVDEQLLARDITDPRVVDAMRRVPRDRFVPADQRPWAYEDRPLPIGYRQTISQPYIVAYMTQALRLTSNDKVLEIGTGSGYQAAVLAELVAAVYSIEIVQELATRAEETLTELGYTNVHVRAGDGYAGWPEEAPFDAIIVTAAPDHIPQPLVDQLGLGGRLIIPVGQNRQALTILTRTADGIERESDLPVMFVPMTGEAEQR